MEGGREGERVKKSTFSLTSKFLFLSSMFLKAIFSDHATEWISKIKIILVQVVLTIPQVQTETPFPPNSQNTSLLISKNPESSHRKDCLVLITWVYRYV